MNRAMCGLLFFFALTVGGASGCSVAMYSSKFHDATTNDKIEVGMTKDDVRQVLGAPQEVRARQTTVDLREVWTYVDRDYSGRGDSSFTAGWWTLTILTVGIAAPLLPPWSKSTHYLIFSDGKVIGWDLRDPFAPDLIIEKRER